MKTLITTMVILAALAGHGQQIIVVKQTPASDVKYSIASEQAERLKTFIKKQAVKEELNTGLVANETACTLFLTGLDSLIENYKKNISTFDTVTVEKETIEDEITNLQNKLNGITETDQGVLLTTAEYRELIKRIRQLEKQLATSTPSIKEWDFPVSYQMGDKVTYMDDTWVCIQAHTSNVGWKPNIVPALWNKKNKK